MYDIVTYELSLAISRGIYQSALVDDQHVIGSGLAYELEQAKQVLELDGEYAVCVGCG